MKISTITDLLELSTMIHVVRNQIKCILINERPRDISLARLRDLICRVYQSVNDVSVVLFVFVFALFCFVLFCFVLFCFVFVLFVCFVFVCLFCFCFVCLFVVAVVFV